MADETREYTLLSGVHTWIDGVTYGVGDKLMLTESQMKRIGKHRFVEENERDVKIVDVDATATPPNTDEAEISELLSKSIPDIKEELGDVSDLSILTKIYDSEMAGKKRVGVLTAINDRRLEVESLLGGE